MAMHLEPHERRAFIDAASAFLATFEQAEARLADQLPPAPASEVHRNMVRLLKELRAKYPEIQAFHFRGWLFNPVRIDGKGKDGKPFVLDFLQTLHDGAVCEIE